MGYTKANGQAANTVDEVLANLATIDTLATQSGAAFELGDRNSARLDATVAAIAGSTSSLAIAVQTAPTASGSWTTVGSFTAFTTASTQHKVFSPLDRFVRLQSVLTGAVTAGATFSVSGEAV